MLLKSEGLEVKVARAAVDPLMQCPFSPWTANIFAEADTESSLDVDDFDSRTGFHFLVDIPQLS